MTVRFDPNRLHAGRVTLSVYPGHGILAENAPSDGENGPALAYKPEWFGSEIRYEIITPPSNGQLDFDEKTTFTYTGNGQPDSFVLQGFRDGLAEGELTTVNILAAATDIEATIAFNMPQFGIGITAESDQPSNGALVSFFMPQFSFAADADNTLPDYQAGIGFTMPQFSITVICGDIVFGTSKGARTEIVAYSRRSEYNQ